MNPLWAVHGRAIFASAGPWLFVQPFLVPLAFGSWGGAALLEGQLVFLAGLVAAGLQVGSSRERMEYLRQLPLVRGEAERWSHVSGLVVVLLACAFCWLSEVTGVVHFLWQAVGRGLSLRTTAPVWEAHAFRWAWLNVFGLPILAYWIVTAAFRRRRSVSGEPARKPWGARAAILIVPFLVLLFPTVDQEARQWIDHDPWARSLPGLAALLLSLPLARWVLRRSSRIGVDAYPSEAVAWDS